MNNPNVSSLRSSAKALGYAITKVSNGADHGYSEYVIHKEGAYYDDCIIFSLHGIAAIIKDLEMNQINTN
jgi:hypothetical protein